MPAEDDISIEEKRVYAGSAGRTDVYVASADGLVRVAVSGDKIGEFGMAADVTARDVAVARRPAAPDVLAVATPEDLLVGAVDGATDGDGPDAIVLSHSDYPHAANVSPLGGDTEDVELVASSASPAPADTPSAGSLRRPWESSAPGLRSRCRRSSSGSPSPSGITCS